MTFRLTLFVCLTSLLTACGTENSSKTNQTPIPEVLPSTDPITLTAAGVSVTVDPSYGARITSYQYKGREILQTKRDSAGLMFGSTVWTSPQADWNWPPPAVFDTEPYEVVKLRDNVYVFTSGLDENSGFQLEKRVQLMANGELGLRYKVKNETGMSTQVAAWEVTRLPYAGYIEFFVSDTIYTDKGELGVELRDDKGRIYFDEQSTTPRKIFATLRDTAVRYHHDGLVFTKQTMITARNQTVPGQMPLEVYLDPVEGFVEFELQGGAYNLETGQEATMRTKWTVREEQE